MSDEPPAEALDRYCAEFERTPEGQAHQSRLDRIAALPEPKPDPRWLGWAMIGLTLALIAAGVVWRLR